MISDFHFLRPLWLLALLAVPCSSTSSAGAAMSARNGKA